MFDAHRHLPGDQDIPDALYCTSRRDEWERLLSLPHPAIGAIGCLATSEFPTIGEFAQFLESHPHLQVGEVGLDKRFGAMEEQKRFLLATLDLAYSLGRSVTAHVVRSDGLFLSCLGQAGKRLPTILWHGFTSSLETATEAARKGCILSLGPGVAHARLAGKLQQVSRLPFAIETDYDGSRTTTPYPQVVEGQYSLIGRLMGVDRETLIRNNDEKRTVLTNNTPAW
ncbi:TatD family hydrolase [Sphaerochaeta sp. PS]|uniref:TatD family hydrolase n=1 Tax=Sphaerochaeta sp. PS TaxID=3076336 RepID=UPI0028A4E455|nr:TatD family hydrolase [Sphaerochaeta sp. PS]MDT4762031.1 TatD family hydrolase [Sphaerochaeta sp. PS]